MPSSEAGSESPALLGVGSVRTLLAGSGITPSRYRGQNFLADPNTVRRIVRLAGIQAGERVLEVGVGLGSLTVGLAAAGALVTGFEIDPGLAAVARTLVPASQVSIVEADATALDWAAVLDADVRVFVANLPYSVGTTILLDVLEQAPQIRRAVVMLQREVGERLCASADEDAYGATSVKVAWFGRARLAGVVGRDVFVPKPEVASVLVAFERGPARDGGATARLFAVVDAGFAQRRKTLRKALAARYDAGAVVSALDAAGIDGSRRAETLSLDEFLALAGHL